MSEPLYLVWSNEHRAWWKAGGYGYCSGLGQAGRYSRDAALRICREALPTAAHIGVMSEIPVRLEDVDAMLDGAPFVPAGVRGEPCLMSR